METRETLFSHVIRQFTTRLEEAATVGLCFILTQWPPATRALIAKLNNLNGDWIITQSGGVIEPLGLLFEGQAKGEDKGRPDIVGFEEKADQTRHNWLLIEAKFDARLTDKQKELYRASFPTTSIVLFICPDYRLKVLRQDLNECVENLAQNSAPGSAVQVPPPTVALLSWSQLLTTLEMGVLNEAGATNDGEIGTDREDALSDIQQLKGLCLEMKNRDWQDFTSTDFLYREACIITQLFELVDEVAAAVNSKEPTIECRRSQERWPAWWGQVITIKSWKAFLEFSAERWADHVRPQVKGAAPNTDGPLWLTFYLDGNPQSQLDLLEKHFNEMGRRCYWTQGDYVGLGVCLTVATNCDRGEVVAKLADEIILIMRSLP